MLVSPFKKALLLGLSLGMMLGVAGTVLAADPKLDEANTLVDRAIKLLEAADNKDRSKGAEFGGHRRAAIDHLKKAQKEIGKAKTFDDRDDKKDGGKPTPDPDPKGDAGPKPDPKGGAGTKPKPKP
ncbi:MAG TPA: hypothetical protein VFZ53_29400 [Polyangiaceae bacterium]